MRSTVFPTPPSSSAATSPGLARRLLLLGAAAVAAAATASAAVTDISNALFPYEPATPANGINIDTAIGTGNTGRLVGITQTHWTSNLTLPVDLNENTLILGSGGNNRNYNGAISGNGELRVINGGQNRIGGSVGNTYTGTTNVNNGCVWLEKTTGNALCGTITVKGSLDTPVVWVSSNQISDTSNVILSNTGALNLAGFTDTINELYLVTGTQVQTGAGGILKVAKLYINGTQQAEVAKGVDGVYVTGSGWIEVGASGPLVVTVPPAAPVTPVPADATSTVNPALLTKLDWADSSLASGYDVYLWLASGAKPATPTAPNVLISEYTVSPQVLSLENYKWQVVAKNTVGQTAGPEWTFSTIDRRDISGILTQSLDAVVGAGPARLIANATSYWGGTTAASSINLNGYQFTIYNGGGNAQTYNGAITGPGTLRIQGNGGATWYPDIQLGGTVANSPDGVTLDYGRLQLNKTAGVDALAGAITVNTIYTVRIQLLKSNQINDASTITSTASSGAFYLEMGGFSDTINGLDIKTGHMVDTGTGGVLTVTDLTVNGAVMPPGTYTSSSSFVLGTGSVVVPGATTPADALTSTVAAAPSSVLADGSTTATITVTLLDATSAAVPGKTVTLASSRAAGTDTISAASGTSNDSGVVTFTVTSSTPGSPVFTATDTTDSVTVSQTASVTFTAIPPADADTSTVAASPTSLRADGVSTATITVTLLNAGSNPVAGKTVTLASSRAPGTDTISPASGTSNASGVAIFSVKSTTVGTPVFTATDTIDGVTVSQTVTVGFTTNPAASASQSTVEASPGTVVANGSTPSTITVTLKDGGGSAVAGKTVTLASNRAVGTDTISAASGVSSAAGVVTFTVTSLTAGTPVFTATVSNDSITVSQTATVTFTAATNVVDISNVTTPGEPANPAAGVDIDTVVGAGKTGRLIGLTQTVWWSHGYSRALDLNGNTLIIDSGNGNVCIAAGAISGNGVVKLDGGGQSIRITGSTGNTYSGTTEVVEGSVSLEKTSGDALRGPITVTNGGLIWAADNQLPDTSAVTLVNGGTFLNLAGHSDTLGTLALSSDANIYLGSGSAIVHFADSSAATWTTGKQLVIREWNGSPTGGGTEGVFFGASASGLSAGQVAHIGFMNPAGFAAGLYHAAILATGEVVPAGSAVVPVAPPYDLSPAATAARTAIYTSTGRADLTAAGSPLTTGTHIVFFGDSITWQNTYISMLDDAIAAGAGTQGKTITLINRGINGGTTANIRDGIADGQASFASLLVSDQADIAVVYIGINDIWWAGTTAAAYEQGLRDLAATAAAHGVTLIFATPAAHGESPVGAGGDDAKIDQFSGIMQTVAASTGATFVDLRTAFVNYWKNNNYEIRLDGSFVTLTPYGLLTYDGVHPTNLGNQMIADQMAEGLLAALTVGSAFDTWAGIGTGGKGLTGAAAAFDADPDHDGISNGIEFVIGGEPNPATAGYNSSALLPTVEASGNNLVFTFTRTHAAAYLNPVVEFDADMQGVWTTATSGNATIAVTPGTTADTVTVTIPKGVNQKLFARLKVVNTP